MRVYATYNIKGGVGKTSTAVNLAYLAAASGRRVLLWDLDPQGPATFLFRVKPRVKGGGRGLVSGKRPIDDAVKATDFDNLDLLPADFSYRNMDLELTTPGSEPTASTSCCPVWPTTMTSPSWTARPACRWCRRTCSRGRRAARPLIPATLSLRTYTQLTRFVADAPRPRPQVVAFFSMADRRKRLHREVIDAIPRDRGRIADTVVRRWPSSSRWPSGARRSPPSHRRAGQPSATSSCGRRSTMARDGEVVAAGECSQSRSTLNGRPG